MTQLQDSFDTVNAGCNHGCRRHGYRIFANEPNLHANSIINYIEYSFIKVDQWGRAVVRQSLQGPEQ